MWLESQAHRRRRKPILCPTPAAFRHRVSRVFAREAPRPQLQWAKRIGLPRRRHHAIALPYTPKVAALHTEKILRIACRACAVRIRVFGKRAFLRQAHGHASADRRRRRHTSAYFGRKRCDLSLLRGTLEAFAHDNASAERHEENVSAAKKGHTTRSAGAAKDAQPPRAAHSGRLPWSHREQRVRLRHFGRIDCADVGGRHHCHDCLNCSAYAGRAAESTPSAKELQAAFNVRCAPRRVGPTYCAPWPAASGHLNKEVMTWEYSFTYRSVTRRASIRKQARKRALDSRRNP